MRKFVLCAEKLLCLSWHADPEGCINQEFSKFCILRKWKHLKWKLSCKFRFLYYPEELWADFTNIRCFSLQSEQSLIKPANLAVKFALSKKYKLISTGFYFNIGVVSRTFLVFFMSRKIFTSLTQLRNLYFCFVMTKIHNM